MKKRIIIPFILVTFLIAGLVGYQYLGAATYTQPLYGSYDLVPTADATTNVAQRDVVGNKADAAAAGAVSTTESLMAYMKQAVGEQIAIDTVVDSILVDTAVIGALGAGLTDLGGMSTGMKAEVNTEIDGALNTAVPDTPTANSLNDILSKLDGANTFDNTTDSLEAISEALSAGTGATVAIDADNLDHLLTTAVDTNYSTTVASNSVAGYITATSDTATYDRTTDSLEALGTAATAILADTEAQDTNTEINVLWAHPRCVEKSDGSVSSGLDAIFTISGGPVRAKITGIVTTVLVGASNAELVMTTTEPAATVSMNAAAVAIDADAAGASYRNVGGTSVFTPVDAGFVIIDPVTVEDCSFLLPIGTVSFSSSAAQTGVIKWYMDYVPLSPNSVVTAAS